MSSFLNINIDAEKNITLLDIQGNSFTGGFDGTKIIVNSKIELTPTEFQNLLISSSILSTINSSLKNASTSGSSSILADKINIIPVSISDGTITLTCDSIEYSPKKYFNLTKKEKEIGQLKIALSNIKADFSYYYEYNKTTKKYDQKSFSTISTTSCPDFTASSYIDFRIFDKNDLKTVVEALYKNTLPSNVELWIYVIKTNSGNYYPSTGWNKVSADSEFCTNLAIGNKSYDTALSTNTGGWAQYYSYYICITPSTTQSAYYYKVSTENSLSEDYFSINNYFGEILDKYIPNTSKEKYYLNYYLKASSIKYDNNIQIKYITEFSQLYNYYKVRTTGRAANEYSYIFNKEQLISSVSTTLFSIAHEDEYQDWSSKGGYTFTLNKTNNTLSITKKEQDYRYSTGTKWTNTGAFDYIYIIDIEGFN